jgi:alcohol dehydrogenase (cytochrome c)
MTGSYDAQEDLLYWGVGNPKPDYDNAARRGDNLYTNSVVALRGSDGKLVWYFQFTPADDHDWDAAQIPILADAKSPQGPEKRLLWANRNGFYYVLNRVSGRFLTATPFAKTTWADGVDATGRPLLHVDSSPLHKGVVIYPGNTGATNWWSPSFDPAANRVFVPVIEQGMVYFPSERTAADKTSASESWPTGLGMSLYTAVRALDASTGKLVWEYRRAPRAEDNAIAGVLSTESGVLFGGDQSTFFALNSQTGTLLWSFATGGIFAAAPVTYSVKGQQFVAIAAGSDLLAFALKDARRDSIRVGHPHNSSTSSLTSVARYPRRAR